MSHTPAPVETTGTVTRSLWDEFLFEPQSTSPMTLVRIAAGVLTTFWAISLLPDVDPLLTRGALGYDRPLPNGSWNLLELTTWKGAPLAACLLVLVAGVAMTIGFRTRLSAAVAALGMISLQRTNPMVFNSGDLVLRQILIAAALAPCGLLLSVDALRARRKGGSSASLRRAPWAMRLLQLELAIGYFLSFWAKVQGATWHDGTAVVRAMRIQDVSRFVAPDWLFRQAELLNALSWATLAFEAVFVFAVWNRRLRPWVIGFGIAFHLGIDVMFDVGFFSPSMMTIYLAFLPPEVADRIVDRLGRRFGLGAGGPAVQTEAGSGEAVGLTVEPAE